MRFPSLIVHTINPPSSTRKVKYRQKHDIYQLLSCKAHILSLVELCAEGKRKYVVAVHGADGFVLSTALLFCLYRRRGLMEFSVKYSCMVERG